MTALHEQPGGGVRPVPPRRGARAQPGAGDQARAAERRRGPSQRHREHQEAYGAAPEQDDFRLPTEAQSPATVPAVADEGPTGLTVNGKAVIPVPQSILDNQGLLYELYGRMFDTDPGDRNAKEMRSDIERSWLEVWGDDGDLLAEQEILAQFLNPDENADDALVLTMFAPDVDFLCEVGAVQSFVDVAKHAGFNPRIIFLNLCKWAANGNVGNLAGLLGGDLVLTTAQATRAQAVQTAAPQATPPPRGPGRPKGSTKKKTTKRRKKKRVKKKVPESA